MNDIRITTDAYIIWQSAAWPAVRLNATILFTWAVMAILVLGSWCVTRRLTDSEKIPRLQNLLDKRRERIRGRYLFEPIVRDDPLRRQPGGDHSREHIFGRCRSDRACPHPPQQVRELRCGNRKLAYFPVLLVQPSQYSHTDPIAGIRGVHTTLHDSLEVVGDRSVLHESRRIRHREAEIFNETL